MGLISEKDREQIKNLFKSLKEVVKIITFTQEFECEYCKMTKELVKEVSDISEKISFEIYDFIKDKELAKKYSIDKIPATLLIGDRDYGIRFFGVPSGYEFTTFIQDIVDVSNRVPDISKDVLNILSKIDKPVHIQVLISPTCPYCAQAVLTAHRFAIVNENIKADMIELTEFPHFAVKYNVQGVPTILINEGKNIVGSIPDNEFAQTILRTIEK